MTLATPPSQDLIRKAVIEVVQLPENELLAVIELVNDLKKQRERPNRESSVQIVARAKQRASELSHLSREELMNQFGVTLDVIRAEAIAKGTAIEGELKGD